MREWKTNIWKITNWHYNPMKGPRLSLIKFLKAQAAPTTRCLWMLLGLWTMLNRNFTIKKMHGQKSFPRESIWTPCATSEINSISNISTSSKGRDLISGPSTWQSRSATIGAMKTLYTAGFSVEETIGALGWVGRECATEEAVSLHPVLCNREAHRFQLWDHITSKLNLSEASIEVRVSQQQGRHLWNNPLIVVFRIIRSSTSSNL